MAYRARKITVRFNQILIYADGPQLLLLDTATTTRMIAVAVNIKGYRNPFLGVEISREQFGDYLSQKFDLRYVFTNPTYRPTYIFEYDALFHGDARLTSMELADATFEKMLPEHGLFARDHTEAVEERAFAPQGVHKFNIDGSWDLPEFSKFYGQLTDLYAMFNGVDVYLDEQAALDDRRRVQEAFMKPWQGGGSYGSFYDSLQAVQDRYDRLKVGGIQYNSPGYLDVRGRDEPFEDIYKLIENLTKYGEELSKGYGDLRKFLAENKLLTLAADKFDRHSDLAIEIGRRAKTYADQLDAVPFAALMRMAGNDQLIVAKVLLSVYRRATRLNAFVLEGRVTVPG